MNLSRSSLGMLCCSNKSSSYRLKQSGFCWSLTRANHVRTPDFFKSCARLPLLIALSKCVGIERGSPLFTTGQIVLLRILNGWAASAKYLVTESILCFWDIRFLLVVYLKASTWWSPPQKRYRRRLEGA